MRKKTLSLLAILATVGILLGAKIIQDNTLQIGDGGATDKEIVADMGNGATNPRIKFNNSTSKWNFSDDGSTFSTFGDLYGPASSTDHGIARFDGTSGKLLQNTSGPTINDSGTYTAATAGATAISIDSNANPGVRLIGNVTTTNSGILEIKNFSTAGGVMRLKSPDESNIYWFKIPNGAAGNLLWQFPATAGSSGQFLSTDGAGVLSWANASQKQYEEGTTYNTVNLDVTGTNWTDTRGVFIPYQTSDGAWRLKANIVGTTSSGTTFLTLTIAGVTFKDLVGYDQACAARANSSNYVHSETQEGTGNIDISAGGSSTIWGVSCDVELDSKPTWAD